MEPGWVVARRITDDDTGENLRKDVLRDGLPYLSHPTREHHLLRMEFGIDAFSLQQ